MKRLAKTTLMTAMVAMVSFSIYAQTGRDIAQRVKDPTVIRVAPNSL